jgi:hypothetical protein
MAFPQRAETRSHRSTITIASLVALVLLSFLVARPLYPRVAGLFDFRAFYCAGSAVAAGRDPYRTEPLRSCWNATKGFRPGYGVAFAVPVPLPGAALAPFVLLSRLPFAVAADIWVLVLLASFAATVILLCRLCDWRSETIVAALLLPLGLRSILLGQTVPIVCAATVAAAFLATRGRDRAAALVAVLTMFEPHLGLPVWLALFIARPRSRVVLTICGAGLVFASLALLGTGLNLEYVRDVLPAHALSEISNEEQYSLSYLAHAAGLGEQSAARLGTLSYLVMLGAGIFAGRMAAARTGAAALAVLVPPAFVVLGGPFVHVQQLAIAIPAALVVSGLRVPGARLCAIAVVLLAVPWGALALIELNVPVLFGVTFVLARELLALSVARSALLSAASGGVALALLSSLGEHPVPVLGPLDPRDGVALAEVGWRTFIEQDYRSNVLQNNLAKIPGWSGLLLVVLGSVGLGPARVERQTVESTSASAASSF